MKVKDIEEVMMLLAKYKIDHIKIDGLELVKTIHKPDEIKDKKEVAELDEETLFYSTDGE